MTTTTQEIKCPALSSLTNGGKLSILLLLLFQSEINNVVGFSSISRQRTTSIPLRQLYFPSENIKSCYVNRQIGSRSVVSTNGDLTTMYYNFNSTTLNPNIIVDGLDSNTLLQELNQWAPPPDKIFQRVSQDDETVSMKKEINKSSEETQTTSTSSLLSMLSFAIPALGIFLSSPLLSNIDNSFVGNTVGPIGLAALSPATICSDQALYLFSCLASATTNIVSRAKTEEDAREIASAPIFVSLALGISLSLFYVQFTPSLLNLLGVESHLRPMATGYIHWRGAVSSWAGLLQSVALSILLARNDAMTPLKIVGLSVLANIIGDFALCVWPLRAGCIGAAAASSFATFLGTGLLVKTLMKKGLWPGFRVPGWKELKELGGYCGPLFLVTLTRFTAFAAMQYRAISLDFRTSAAYQLCINTMLFFMLFGEPFSQLCQNKLPPLIEKQNSKEVEQTMKGILKLSVGAAAMVGSVAYALLKFGTGCFTSDVFVKGLTSEAALSVFVSVAVGIMYCAFDGAMFAAREYKFILMMGVVTCLMQLAALPFCSTLTGIFMTFVMRLGIFSIGTMIRMLMGKGTLGEIIDRRNWFRFGRRRSVSTPVTNANI